MGNDSLSLFFVIGTGVHTGVPETCSLQQVFRTHAVKSHPGVPPRLLFVSLVIGGLHGGDEESIPCFQMIGLPVSLIDSLSVQHHVDEIVGTDSRAKGMSGGAWLGAAEIDGQGTGWLWVHFAHSFIRIITYMRYYSQPCKKRSSVNSNTLRDAHKMQ